jgi:type IV secretion system protein VirB1
MRTLATFSVMSLSCFAVDPPLKPLSSAEFATLAKQCVPDAPPSTLRAITKVESAFHPLAISINYPEKASSALGLEEGSVALSRQPATLREAVQWTKWLYSRGLTVSVGLMQVNAEHLAGLGLSLEQAFEPCANLKAGWSILNARYRTAAAVLGKGQLALHAAISSYNSGSSIAGFNTGYVEKVIQAEPQVSSIPLFAGPLSMVRAAEVPRKEDPPLVPPELEPLEDPNIAPTPVNWSTKAK